MIEDDLLFCCLFSWLGWLVCRAEDRRDDDILVIRPSWTEGGILSLCRETIKYEGQYQDSLA